MGQDQYVRAGKLVRNRPLYTFKLAYPVSLSIGQLWDLLQHHTSLTCEAASDRIQYIRENSATARCYGPSIRDLVDHHGHLIRTAGSASKIEEAANACNCSTKYPKYTDLSVGHVRTSDCSILPTPLGNMAKLGLNFRPYLFRGKQQLAQDCKDWAALVIKKIKLKAVRDNQSLILNAFAAACYRLSSHRKGLMLSKLAKSFKPFKYEIAVFSTDKVQHTPSFECVNWMRLTLLRRLQSDAFTPCEYPLSTLGELASFVPWLEEWICQPAILFLSAKVHKRIQDPLAYRYITSACSDRSKPLSGEGTRVLTSLWGEAKALCLKLQVNTGAKYWWALDSLDIVPLNVDTKYKRPNRQPSAFDLEKCFESIQLSEGEHSLLTRVKIFLDLVWKGEMFLCSEMHLYKPGPCKDCFWSKHKQGWGYSKQELLNLVSTVSQLAVITVGDTAAMQSTGIPMGFDISVLFLNIYMFTYEYAWVDKLSNHCTHMLSHTVEIFRYIDDLGNFLDLDLRPFLIPRECTEDWDWIYPLAPFGPLSIKDQTERSNSAVSVIYLNMAFRFVEGWLSYRWYDKSTNLHIPAIAYTNWGSAITRSCKLGIIASQTRAAMLTASSLDICADNLHRLAKKLLSAGYPADIIKEHMLIAYKQYLPRLPLPYASLEEHC